ncbi:MAG: restriction endonuclease subunit S [Planctomycetota bacterium]
MNTSKWERKPLGAVADLCLGKMLDQNKNKGEPLPYLANVNVRWGEFSLDSLRTMRFEPKEIERYGLKFGDIVMCEGGEPGRCAIWKNQVPGMMIQKALHRIRPSEVLDYRFLHYNFLHIGSSKGFDQFFTGSTIKHLPLEKLAKVEVNVPPLPIQHRIAGILSAYDELMENSQRRIRILETMARALYREWFVEFRFPGHEKDEFVASPLGRIPKGWEVKRVADSFEISGGGTPSRKQLSYWDEGTIQWFAPSDLTAADTMFMDDSPECITEFGLAKSSARLFPAFSVMMTSRATIGAIAINTHEACTNQGFITCLSNERVPLYFLFHWLTENVPTFQRMASGATFKEISRGVFKTIEFLHPSEGLVCRFESQVEPMSKQMLAFQRQIQNLRRTRDLLLPRLLSGQVSLGRN